MKFTTKRILHYGLNEIGRDFAVGDIHGQFSRLRECLAQRNFNPVTDRLFAVGDLTDRGSESADVLKWLAMPWFHSVRGNHEQLAIAYHRHPKNRFCGYTAEGGAWFAVLPFDERQEIVDAFASLPLAIEVVTRTGLKALVHADCPSSSWESFKQWVNTTKNVHELISSCMESRDRLQYHIDVRVDGIEQIYVGHSRVNDVVSLGNITYLDTGGWHNDGKFSIVEL